MTQSYGNCPKYINTRELTTQYAPSKTFATKTRTALNAHDRSVIRAADTFFIASYYDAGKGNRFEGADISHRGDQTGFVHVVDNELTVPDYAGNNLFNTLGNLLMHPHTALLFVDFETGDTLHLTGTAEIITNEAEIAGHPKATRLLRVVVTGATRIEQATSLRWGFREVSPYNPDPSLKQKA